VRVAVYHNLPSGGAKRALHEIVRRLCDRHQFDVYTMSSADHDFGDLRPYATRHQIYEFSDAKLLESPFGRMNMLIRSGDLRKVQTINRQIAKEIEQAGYDVLFVNPCRIETGPTILQATTMLPKFYYCQEPPRVLYEEYPVRPYTQKSSRREMLDRLDPLPGMYFKTLRENDRQNFFAADLVLVNSHFMQQNIANVYGTRAEVCYLGTDPDAFQPAAVEKGEFVLSVGSLTPLKNFDFLIQAIACIPANQRPELWIASNFQNPPERSYLEALAVEQGVHLKLLGNITDAELGKLYNQAAVTVYSPIREPFGLVPLEAMACGTPVVAVCEGGMAETIVDGVTGYLVDRDLKNFADAVLDLLSDPHKASQFGLAGRNHVLQNWTWDLAASRFEAFLCQARSKN
jgi:glycosyltransferase involved in cell wall biosynthesis